MFPPNEDSLFNTGLLVSLMSCNDTALESCCLSPCSRLYLSRFSCIFCSCIFCSCTCCSSLSSPRDAIVLWIFSWSNFLSLAFFSSMVSRLIPPSSGFFSPSSINASKLSIAKLFSFSSKSPPFIQLLYSCLRSKFSLKKEKFFHLKKNYKV